MHLAEGLPAKKVPLSGALGGEFSGDLTVLDGLKAEVKGRKNAAGFKVLEKWMQGCDIIFISEPDNAYCYVAMTWRAYISLATKQPLCPVKSRQVERKNQLRTIIGWMKNNALIFLKRDRCKPIVFMPQATYYCPSIRI